MTTSDIATIEREPLHSITIATIDDETMVLMFDYSNRHHVAASLSIEEAEDVGRKLLAMVETARGLCDCSGID